MTDRDDWNYTNETLAPGQPHLQKHGSMKDY